MEIASGTLLETQSKALRRRHPAPPPAASICGGGPAASTRGGFGGGAAALRAAGRPRLVPAGDAPVKPACYGIRSASMTRRPGFVVAMSSSGPAASRTSAMVPSCRRALLCRPPLPHQRHGRCAREGYWGRIRRVRLWMKKQPIHIEASVSSYSPCCNRCPTSIRRPWCSPFKQA